MPDYDPDPPTAGPVLVIDDDARCGTTHVWSVDFAWGDTCECGTFYLLRDACGRPVMQETERGL